MATNWKYEYDKLKEKFMFWVAWKMPKWLVYYCTIRVFSHSSTGNHSNTEAGRLTVFEALHDWGYKK